jgi:hypothetical protein
MIVLIIFNKEPTQKLDYRHYRLLPVRYISVVDVHHLGYLILCLTTDIPCNINTHLIVRNSMVSSWA